MKRSCDPRKKKGRETAAAYAEGDSSPEGTRRSVMSMSTQHTAPMSPPRIQVSRTMLCELSDHPCPMSTRTPWYDVGRSTDPIPSSGCCSMNAHAAENKSPRPLFEDNPPIDDSLSLVVSM